MAIFSEIRPGKKAMNHDLERYQAGERISLKTGYEIGIFYEY
jgi:hypothetical protein